MDLRNRPMGVDDTLVSYGHFGLADVPAHLSRSSFAPVDVPSSRFSHFAMLTAIFGGLGVLAVLVALAWQSNNWMQALAYPLGLIVMVAVPFVLGRPLERVLGRAWPALKWVLIIGAILTFLIPFVRAGESGIASVYSTHDHDQPGTQVACPGRKLNDGALTAAHRSLPCGTKVKVTNHKNGKSVVVTITDRGPFVRGRIIDLTRAAAAVLGIAGLAPVTIERVS